MKNQSKTYRAAILSDITILKNAIANRMHDPLAGEAGTKILRKQLHLKIQTLNK